MKSDIQQNYLNRLTEFRSILLDEESTHNCHNLAEYFDYEIPRELCNILIHSERVNSLNVGLWFSTVASYDAMISAYNGVSEKWSFFNIWNIDKDFYINYDGYFPYINSDSNGFLDNPVDLTSIKNIVPFMYDDGTGDFILYHLDPSCNNLKLLFIGSDGIIDAIGVSLVEHVDDLIDGLKDGRYHIDEEENYLVSPFLWFDKQRLKAGKVTMGKYGEIIE